MSALTKEELLSLQAWCATLEKKGIGRLLVGIYLEGAFAASLGISAEEMKKTMENYYAKGAAL